MCGLGIFHIDVCTQGEMKAFLGREKPYVKVHFPHNIYKEAGKVVLTGNMKPSLPSHVGILSSYGVLNIPTFNLWGKFTQDKCSKAFKISQVVYSMVGIFKSPIQT